MTGVQTCALPISEEFLKRLNGKKYYIFGNHDKHLRKEKFLQYFEWMKEYAEISIDGKHSILFHYPIFSWNKMHYGSYQFYGHTHGQIPHIYHGRSMDVGVDTNNCYPYNIRKIFEMFKDDSDENGFYNDPRGR